MHFSFDFPCSMWQETETSMRILFPISEQSCVFLFPLDRCTSGETISISLWSECTIDSMIEMS